MASKVTRREFIRDGVAAFTVSFAAPAFLVDIARAQGAVSRNLVVIYLAGGNDALSTLIPYTDPFYFSRRPAIAVPAAQALQIGTDASGKALGLHPRLTGLQTIFKRGTPRHRSARGVSEFEPLALPGNRHLGHGGSEQLRRPRLARPLSRHAAVADRPACRVEHVGTTYRALAGATIAVPSITDPRNYSFASPNVGTEAINERNSAIRLASYAGPDRPNLAFVNTSAMEAFATLDRVGSVVNYQSSVTYPNNGFGAALKTVAGSIARGIGTRVYWCRRVASTRTPDRETRALVRTPR